MSSTTLTPELNKELFSSRPQTHLQVEPGPHSALWGRFMEPYLSGAEPVCCELELPEGLEGDVLIDCIPADLIQSEFRGPAALIVLVETPTFAAIIQRWSHRSGSVTVRARTRDTAAEACAELLSWFPDVDTPTGVVSVDFWQSNRNMFTTSRKIDAAPWGEVDRHYPAEVGASLASLMETNLVEPEGRVMLWHGPPGTGKTSAIRTLAREWSEQARFQIVLDPEPVFSHSANLMQVILNSQDDEATGWRVLVIEDADELVRADNATTSQSLSRLLNVGDGIVGQGLKILVLLTTNEPPARLHPALTRPGRCLSNVAFRRFTAGEAAAAFPDNETVHGAVRELTLAEILTGRVNDADGQSAPGLYL